MGHYGEFKLLYICGTRPRLLLHGLSVKVLPLALNRLFLQILPADYTISKSLFP